MAAALKCTSFEEEQLPNKREAMNWKPRKVKPKILGQTKAAECLLKNIPRVLDSDSEESEFSDLSPYEDDVRGSSVDHVHIQPDLEDLGDEISSMPEDVTSPEQQTALVYEVEDWDKELEDSECNPYEERGSENTPSLQASSHNVHQERGLFGCGVVQTLRLCSEYDASDLYCGSFQENNLLVSNSLQEDSLYNPCCHHAARLAFTVPVRMTEAGQFDDADE